MKLNIEITKIILLLAGTVAITFSGLNWHIGITAWIGPIFLLLYTRKAKWFEFLLFFLVVSVSGALSQTCNNLLHLPSVNVFNGLSFGVLYSIPYIIDRFLYKKSKGFYYSLIFPASVALVEFIASFAIGTWGSVAHTQYEFKQLMQLGSLTGICGIWFMVAWFASVINWIIENKDQRPAVYRGAIIYGSTLFFVLLYGQVRLKSNVLTKNTVKVAAVLSETDIHQIAANKANTFQELSGDYNLEIPVRMFSDSLSVERLIKRTQKAAQQGAEIIVWNEIALIVNQSQKKGIIAKAQTICSKNNVYILLAFLEECVELNKKPFNNVSILISPSGEIVWEYRKSFLHPTAEAPSTNSGNYEMPVTQTPFGKIGNVICVDLDIPNYIQQAGKQSVDILLVPAFDWAEITPLHSQMASLEAIQFGFSVVRANGKGLSAVYNYKGEEIASLNTFNSNEKVLLTDLPVQPINTIYSQTGNILVYLCVLFLVFVIAKRFF